MKKLLFVFSLLFVGIYANAQDKPQFLEVDYQMEMKLDADQVMASVPAAWKAQVEEPLRQEIKNGIFIDYKLKTNGTESEYKMQEKINNDQTPAGLILQQMTAMDKEPLFKDIKEKYFLKPYNVGKAYLVKDSLKTVNWKITKEKETIAGFDTYKATGVMNDSIPVTAWYTPKINIKDGPDRMWGLPGLILKAEFEMNGAELIIAATKVAVKEEEIKITKPSKGQILTEKEFMDEMLAFQEKMKEMYGGGVDSE
ncbi:GLPGLI family protein [Moheibacter lacus]|uniref:GLPGLI family protein n=1 Tax=Moheibacter lacus TaxID=2745851 RepID=A0A838ZT96_9FLAO|nr:GLPGLI family protein [Moheibacter lacus]MBA5630208.1 GLPGLI family protein [Moheibacter lacus]